MAIAALYRDPTPPSSPSQPASPVLPSSPPLLSSLPPPSDRESPPPPRSFPLPPPSPPLSDCGSQPPEPTPPPPERTPTPAPEVKRRIEHFGNQAGEVLNPDDDPGNPYSQYKAGIDGDINPDNPYLPFHTKMDWDIVSWSKSFSIGSNALTALLQIEDVKDRLGLQFSSTRALNAIMDNKLPSRPNFKRRTYALGGEQLDIYMRDSLEVLCELYGRPDFASHLIFVLEKHFVLMGDEEDRAYLDMHTGTWWWYIQTRIELKCPGATIIPLIISSDKTQLTLFRNRSAYPVYFTISNIPKELHRKPSLQGMVLLGYLPVTSLT
ncbi:unnamed protein product, partial [Peniophora sp. CBMAI 1063]